MSTLIGICARGATSGKDTVGQYLIDKYGFVKVNLADAVKEMLYNLNPKVLCEVPQLEELGATYENLLSEDTDDYIGRDLDCLLLTVRDLVDVLGWDKAKQIKEVRELLQRTGTECGRNLFGEDFWVNIAKTKMKGLDRVVCCDVRFPNESTFIHQNMDFDNSLVIEVSKPGVTSLNDHASEVPLPSECYDVQIFNDGSLEDLYAKIDEKIGRYLK